MFRIVTGVVVTLLGGALIVFGLQEALGIVITGGIISAIGIAIVLNRREDAIEEINEK